MMRQPSYPGPLSPLSPLSPQSLSQLKREWAAVHRGPRSRIPRVRPPLWIWFATVTFRIKRSLGCLMILVALVATVVPGIIWLDRQLPSRETKITIRSPSFVIRGKSFDLQGIFSGWPWERSLDLNRLTTGYNVGTAGVDPRDAILIQQQSPLFGVIRSVEILMPTRFQ